MPEVVKLLKFCNLNRAIFFFRYRVVETIPSAYKLSGVAAKAHQRLPRGNAMGHTAVGAESIPQPSFQHKEIPCKQPCSKDEGF